MLFRVIDVSNMGNLIRQGNFFTFFLEVGKTSSSLLSLLSQSAKIKNQAVWFYMRQCCENCTKCTDID